MSEEELKRYKVPNAMPIVYEFDEQLRYLNKYILMDLEAHRVKLENPQMSYNNIKWNELKQTPGLNREKQHVLRKPTYRLNLKFDSDGK